MTSILYNVRRTSTRPFTGYTGQYLLVRESNGIEHGLYQGTAQQCAGLAAWSYTATAVPTANAASVTAFYLAYTANRAATNVSSPPFTSTAAPALTGLMMLPTWTRTPAAGPQFIGAYPSPSQQTVFAALPAVGDAAKKLWINSSTVDYDTPTTIARYGFANYSDGGHPTAGPQIMGPPMTVTAGGANIPGWTSTMAAFDAMVASGRTVVVFCTAAAPVGWTAISV